MDHTVLVLGMALALLARVATVPTLWRLALTPTPLGLDTVLTQLARVDTAQAPPDPELALAPPEVVMVLQPRRDPTPRAWLTRPTRGECSQCNFLIP